MNLSELHGCKKSEGKMVVIEVAKLGIERCGYCGTVVKYLDYFKEKVKSGKELKLNGFKYTRDK